MGLIYWYSEAFSAIPIFITFLYVNKYVYLYRQIYEKLNEIVVRLSRMLQTEVLNKFYTEWDLDLDSHFDLRPFN